MLTTNIIQNKCSAAAEMGDRVRAKWAENCGLLCPSPFFVGGAAGSPSNTMSRGPRPTFLPSGILIHPAVWPQQTWAENCGMGADRQTGQDRTERQTTVR